MQETTQQRNVPYVNRASCRMMETVGRRARAARRIITAPVLHVKSVPLKAVVMLALLRMEPAAAANLATSMTHPVLHA